MYLFLYSKSLSRSLAHHSQSNNLYWLFSPVSLDGNRELNILIRLIFHELFAYGIGFTKFLKMNFVVNFVVCSSYTGLPVPEIRYTFGVSINRP